MENIKTEDLSKGDIIIYQADGKKATCAFFAQIQKEGKRTDSRQIPYYNLDVILSVGYRVKSKTASEFRKWATGVLHKYLLEDYAVNEEMETMRQITLSVLNRRNKVL